jgi:hypothetical protein
MAKKRATTSRKKTVLDPGRRSTVLTIKGMDDWKEWLKGLSDHLRTPISTIVDHSLIMYAKDKGYTREPPKR